MNTILFINPDGATVEVPESDAAHFDGKGWQRADGSTGNGYGSMKVDELKALIAERGIETDATKKAELIAALEAADADNQ